MEGLPSYIYVKSSVRSLLDAKSINHEDINDHIAERVAAILFSDILDKRLSLLRDEASNYSTGLDQYSAGGLSLDLSRGFISLERGVLLKKLFLGFAVLFCMAICLILPRNKHLNSKKISLVFGLTSDQIFKEKSVASLSNFLSDKLFEYNSEVDYFLVERRSSRYGMKHKADKLITTFDIGFYSYKNFLKKSEQLSLFISTLSSFAHLIAHHKETRAEIFCMKDLILDAPLAKLLNTKASIRHLIITPSNLLTKPMLYSIIRSTIPTSMIWYSGNSVPINHLGKFRELFDQSFYKLAHANAHYVWSDAHKNYLQSVTTGRVNISGSLMFYPKKSTVTTNNKFTITVFDVTPTELPIYQASIYSVSSTLDFLEDIEMVQNLLRDSSYPGINWILKPKRNYSKNHSPQYIKRLQSMKLILIDPKMDLYQCIGNTNFVVCVPYTSPAIIAQELGIPVCYFSTATDFDLLDSLDGIPVHKSVEALRTHIERALADYSKAKSEES
jgi:polysaccharide biosynthesis PFTS motif protein